MTTNTGGSYTSTAMADHGPLWHDRFGMTYGWMWTTDTCCGGNLRKGTIPGASSHPGASNVAWWWYGRVNAEITFRAQLAAADTGGAWTELLLSESISVASPFAVPAGARVRVRAGAAGVQVSCSTPYNSPFPAPWPVCSTHLTSASPHILLMPRHSDLGKRGVEDL
jgi:hypothetical protein